MGLAFCRCPPNAYCPEGSWAPNSCPLGTGHPRQGASSEAECFKCSAGVYCLGGRDEKPCDEGFFCKERSTTPRPTDKVMGLLCPAGDFCPTGTTNPRACPIGTFGPTEGLGASCEPCPPGRLCNKEGGRLLWRRCGYCFSRHGAFYSNGWLF